MDESGSLYLRMQKAGLKIKQTERRAGCFQTIPAPDEIQIFRKSADAGERHVQKYDR